MREVLLRRVKYLLEEAELVVPTILIIQILIRFCELHPITSIVFPQIVTFEECLDLLEDSLAQILALLGLEIKLERRTCVLLLL